MLVVFFATLVRSSFGFGEALIAVPLLALFMPVNVAAPLVVLLSISIAAMVVAQDWREIHLSSAAGLLAATVFGVPLGLLLLTHAPQGWVKGFLGVFLLLFASYSLLAKDGLTLEEHHHRSALLLAGFLAGIFGGAYGMNGPPLVIYGALRRWSPRQFRATLHAYFLPASLLGMVGFWSAGLWTRAVTREYLYSLPAMLPAILLGRMINQRIPGTTFLKYVYGGLLLIGLTLLMQTVTH
ncbi:MAG: sulfite exporter TauE/SafE family protein [Acidobacteriota bacterium]|jgi:hypothetical protein